MVADCNLSRSEYDWSAPIRPPYSIKCAMQTGDKDVTVVALQGNCGIVFAAGYQIPKFCKSDSKQQKYVSALISRY